jgi:DNA-directed RNA polymerase specialized sigma24 family protein
MTDQEAIARLTRRDISGLEALVRRYHTRALDAAYLVLGDWALAEDVAQSAFVKAYDRIDTFDIARPFGPWYLRSVVNSAIDVAAGRRDLSLEAYMGTQEMDIPNPEPGLVELLEAVGAIPQPACRHSDEVLPEHERCRSIEQVGRTGGNCAAALARRAQALAEAASPVPP